MKKRTRYQLCLDTKELLSLLKENYPTVTDISSLDNLGAYYAGKRFAFEVLEKHFEQLAKIYEYENADTVSAN